MVALTAVLFLVNLALRFRLHLQLRLQLVAERKLYRRLRLYRCLFVTVQVEGWDDGLT